jgi:predicted ATP-dependent serine protease
MDIYINIVGGLFINDRGCDLGLAMALASSRFARPIKWPMKTSRSGVGFVGEIGLTGIITIPKALASRINAAYKVGLAKLVVPKRWEVETKLKAESFPEMDIVEVDNVKEAIDTCLQEAIPHVKAKASKQVKFEE